jgi:hypothetical protein
MRWVLFGMQNRTIGPYLAPPCKITNPLPELASVFIIESNRMHLVPFGMQNTLFGPYLAPKIVILVSVMVHVSPRPRRRVVKSRTAGH